VRDDEFKSDYSEANIYFLTKLQINNLRVALAFGQEMDGKLRHRRPLYYKGQLPQTNVQFRLFRTSVLYVTRYKTFDTRLILLLITFIQHSTTFLMMGHKAHLCAKITCTEITWGTRWRGG
jgi:hypothetical protein